MQGRLTALMAALLGVILSVKAADADSLVRQAQDPDFIHASLVTLGPGEEVYSLYGHSAIRLECLARQLDYCFTFEMALTTDEELKFLFSTAKAGFIAAPTKTFFDNYRRVGRSIHEQQLNLSPTEEQHLWQLLDGEMKKGAHWDYSFLTTNCSSMCVWIIEQALLKSDEQITYGRLPEAVTGTYRDLLNHISADSPWARLFWNLRMGTKGGDEGELRDKLAPALLEEAWQEAMITDGRGNSRPIFCGSPRIVADQTLAATPTPLLFTPLSLLFLIIFILLTIIFIKSKKGKRMRKLLTSSKRLVLSTALVLTSALTAMAGGDNWYAYHIQADAYPTGAGLVYVDSTMVEDESAIVYAETVAREFTMMGDAPFIYGYGQAAEGWQLLGFVKGVIDENGQVTYPEDDLYEASDFFPAMISLSPELGDGVGSKHYDEASGMEVSDDSLTVAALMPLDPSVYFRGLFTHVAVSVADAQSSMGDVTIDKLCNDIGEQVTLTATPANEFCSFVSWTLDGEVVSTEPMLTVEVMGIANYVANFSDSRSVTLTFPEDGGFVKWYNHYDYDLNYLAEAYAPAIYDGFDNELVDKVGANFLTVITSSYGVAGKTPAILYGMGTVTISPSSGEEASDNDTNMLFKWSGDTDINVAELDQTNDKYYTFDAATGAFSRINEGVIRANDVYMQLPDSLIAEGLTAPETIYISEDVYNVATAISTAKMPRQTAAGQVYDLQGRRLDAINREGIYIFDGKKVIYRRK